MRKLTLFYFYFICLYWYPATLLQWGSYGSVEEAIPAWFKLLRAVLVLVLVAQIASSPSINRKLVMPLAFFCYCVLLSPQLPAVIALGTFVLSIAISYKIRIATIDWDRHIRLISWISYFACALEIAGIVVSPHSYGGELRVVATFGGPNNAGIILSGFALHHYLRFRDGRKLSDLLHFVGCTLVSLQTASLSATMAFALCLAALNPIIAVLLPVLLLATASVNDFLTLKIEHLMDTVNGGNSIGSFNDRVDNINSIIGNFNASPLKALFGSRLGSESDYLGTLGQYGLVGVALLLLSLLPLRLNVFLALGLLQGVFTPFLFSFPSFAILFLLSRIHQYRKQNALAGSPPPARPRAATPPPLA
ncbi:hypothetical protein [Chromobacterium sp. CV08]|uniref:hypothetical protein n=1 Tax=Chromobacterium sp. CV08 TaxID=3133274 RepID=UPI003DA91C1F